MGIPCCLNMISCKDYDDLKSQQANGTLLGGGVGKSHNGCPASAEEAAMIAEEDNQPCCFQFAYGSKMTPCCLNMISCEEYDHLKSQQANGTLLGGGVGKSLNGCPASAEEAAMIAEEYNQPCDDVPSKGMINR